MKQCKTFLEFMKSSTFGQAIENVAMKFKYNEDLVVKWT